LVSTKGTLCLIGYGSRNANHFREADWLSYRRRPLDSAVRTGETVSGAALTATRKAYSRCNSHSLTYVWPPSLGPATAWWRLV